MAKRIACALLIVVGTAGIGVAALRQMLFNAVLDDDDTRTARRIITVLPFLVNQEYDNGVLKIPLLSGAVRAKNRATVRLLLSRGARVDARNHCGETPLMLAAEWGDRDVIHLLLAHGAKVNAKDCIGWTALHHAVHQKKNRVVSTLLSAGANPNDPDIDGDTPVMLAVDVGSRNLVAMLRKHGARHPVTIHEAAAFGDIATVNRLLAAKPALLISKGLRGMTALDYAAAHGQADVARGLLRRGSRPSRLAVAFAADSGSITTVELLLAHGGQLNPTVHTSESTPLHCAVGNGDLKMVRYLVENGADTRAQAMGTTPVKYAREMGHKEIAEYLVKHVTPPNGEGTQEDRARG